jgi:hypothetical protein
VNPILFPEPRGVAGFTGTRNGLAPVQASSLSGMLNRCSPRELQHGDCVGADETVHYMCLTRGIHIHICPPIDGTHRAWCATPNGFVTVGPPGPYLARNRAIVRYCDYLIACPKEMTEVVRSGTWATIRYAEKACKPVYIIFPDGRVDRRPPVG